MIKMEDNIEFHEDFVMFKKVDEWFKAHLEMFNLDKVYGINIISELHNLIKDIETSKQFVNDINSIFSNLKRNKEMKDFVNLSNLVAKQESHYIKTHDIYNAIMAVREIYSDREDVDIISVVELSDSQVKVITDIGTFICESSENEEGGIFMNVVIDNET